MKSSQYDKQVGVIYRTALQWWKDGQVKGYQVARSVKEIGSGLNANRPQFLALLQWRKHEACRTTYHPQG